MRRPHHASRTPAFDRERIFNDRFFLAKTLFRLGELYENANDAKAPTEYYGRFVDLWAKADPRQ